MSLAVTFTPRAERSLRVLDRSVALRIKAKVLTLAEDPHPAGTAKLKGHPDLYRVRVGDYGIVFRVDSARGVVEITVIAHRREVYRDL